MTNKNALHPLTHILMALLLSTMVFIVKKPSSLLFLTLLASIYAAFRMKNGWQKILKTLWHTLPFLLVLSFFQIVFRRGGSLLWSYGILKISSEAVQISIQLALRLLTVIYCAKSLAVMEYPEFSKAFSAIRFPEELSFMLSYAIHLVPKFLAQLKGFVTGLKLRGIDSANLSIAKRLQVYKQLAITSLAELIRNSETSAIALELRGFRSEGKRTKLYQQKFSYRDILFLLVFSGIVVLVTNLS
jgi:energy-coupling factor transport system permease protein